MLDCRSLITISNELGAVDEILRGFDAFLSSHPGYLGWQGFGLEAIHADWPAYPAEHGWQFALESLACFPSGTRFTQVDVIDFAVLFAAQPLLDPTDPHADRNFHVSAWWDDIVALACADLVNGLMTPRESVSEYWTSMSPIFPDLPEPILDDYPDFHSRESRVSASGIWLTPQAVALLQQHAVDNFESIDGALLAQVMPLVLVGRHDAAVRDACILLENSLRAITASESHGQKLVEQSIVEIRRKFSVPEGLLRALRAELRAVIKFTRNEYAHNLVDASPEQGAAILLRLSRLLTLLQGLAPGGRA